MVLPMVAEVVEKSECSEMTSSLLVIEGSLPAVEQNNTPSAFV
jgi:hypothetical protein